VLVALYCVVFGVLMHLANKEIAAAGHSRQQLASKQESNKASNHGCGYYGHFRSCSQVTWEAAPAEETADEIHVVVLRRIGASRW